MVVHRKGIVPQSKTSAKVILYFHQFGDCAKGDLYKVDRYFLELWKEREIT